MRREARPASAGRAFSRLRQASAPVSGPDGGCECGARRRVAAHVAQAGAPWIACPLPQPAPRLVIYQHAAEPAFRRIRAPLSAPRPDSSGIHPSRWTRFSRRPSPPRDRARAPGLWFRVRARLRGSRPQPFQRAVDGPARRLDRPRCVHGAAGGGCLTRRGQTQPWSSARWPRPRKWSVRNRRCSSCATCWWDIDDAAVAVAGGRGTLTVWPEPASGTPSVGAELVFAAGPGGRRLLPGERDGRFGGRVGGRGSGGCRSAARRRACAARPVRAHIHPRSRPPRSCGCFASGSGSARNHSSRSSVIERSISGDTSPRVRAAKLTTRFARSFFTNASWASTRSGMSSSEPSR